MTRRVATRSGHMMIRNPIIVAPSCDCGLVMEPRLLNTTNFRGPVEWTVDWWCPAYGKIGHKSGDDSNG